MLKDKSLLEDFDLVEELDNIAAATMVGGKAEPFMDVNPNGTPEPEVTVVGETTRIPLTIGEVRGPFDWENFCRENPWDCKLYEPPKCPKCPPSPPLRATMLGQTTVEDIAVDIE